MSFHKTLFKLGKWRFGIGYSSKGGKAWIVLFLYSILNLYWWMLIGCLWLCYGMFYLIFYLPIKGIVKLCNRKKEVAINEQN